MRASLRPVSSVHGPATSSVSASGNIEWGPFQLCLESYQCNDKSYRLENHKPQVILLPTAHISEIDQVPAIRGGGKERKEERHLVDKHLGDRPDPPDCGEMFRLSQPMTKRMMVGSAMR